MTDKTTQEKVEKILDNYADSLLHNTEIMGDLQMVKLQTEAELNELIEQENVKFAEGCLTKTYGKFCYKLAHKDVIERFVTKMLKNIRAGKCGGKNDRQNAGKG